LPILDSFGYPSVVFASAALVGTSAHWPRWSQPRRFMTWAALARLGTHGVEVGSHSQTHRRLADLPSTTVATELTESRARIRSAGVPYLDAVAYPYGAGSRAVFQAAREAGYRAGFTAGGLWGNRLGADLFSLRRRVVTSTTSASAVRRIATGVEDWLHLLQRVELAKRSV